MRDRLRDDLSDDSNSERRETAAARAGAAETTDSTAAEAPAFRDALDELEAILGRIEEDLDVDRLAEELRRAAYLLDVCRGKIRKAEVEVTQIVQSLEEKRGGDED
jgi:exodeoxyribonuclease VII small subunit